MNQNRILVALAVVILVVIGVVIYSQKSDNSNDQAEPTNTSANTNDNADITPANSNTTNTETLGQPTTPVTDEPTSPDGNDVAVFEIGYDGKAFSPSELTIKNGDVVIFKNNSDQDFRPASGPHPVHTNYPEFDPKKSIAAGGSWQFKFTKSGSWPFHNHLNPSIGGTITVQ